MRHFSIEAGKKDKSEFIYKIFEPDNDFILDYIFPRSGTNFYFPNWAFKPSNFKIFPVTGFDPFKNPWELR